MPAVASRPRRTPCALALGMALAVAPGRALATSAADAAAPLVPARAEAPITVDGRLDEAAWQVAAPVALAFEIEPGDNRPAPVATDCRLVVDGRQLVFGCRAEDPRPAAIRAFFAERDATDGQDEIGLVLDTQGDARRAVRFVVTPLGVQRDGRLDPRLESWDDGWDAAWRAAGRRTPTGFEVEAAVPFHALRFAAEGGPWRFWFFRHWPRSERVVLRSVPRDRARACDLCQAAPLAVAPAGAAGRDVELAPTLTGTRTDAAPAAGAPLAAGDAGAEAGLDLRFGPRPDLAVNATWNPDFSQIEADVAQLDVNTRFALFYPEKRPFFLEGGDLFATPLDAVFSRTVVDPRWGAKLSGRLGGGEVGAWAARDEAPGLLLPGPYGSREVPLAGAVTTAVARLRRPLAAGGSLGLLATARDGDDYRSDLLGVDAQLRPHPSWTLRAQLLGSRTEDPRAVAAELGRPRRSAGEALHAAAAYADRDWEWGGELRLRDPGFRADAGFVPQVDVRGATARGARLFWGDGRARWTQIGLFGSLWHDRTAAGELVAEGVTTEVWIDGPLQSGAWLQPHLERQRFAGRTFDLGFLRAGARVRPSGSFGAALTFQAGDAIDFATARPATETRLSPSLDLRLGRRWELALDLDRQRLRDGGEELLDARLGELRARHHLSTRGRTQLVVQYRDVSRAGAPRDEGLFAQLLFGYELEPQRALYVGLSEELAGAASVADAGGLEPAARSYFVKLAWTVRP